MLATRSNASSVKINQIGPTDPPPEEPPELSLDVAVVSVSPGTISLASRLKREGN